MRDPITVSPANPGNVPRHIRYVHERGWDQEPAAPQQLRKLRAKFAQMDASGKDIATMFGDEFRSLDLLSKFAASWGLDEIRQAEDDAYRAEAARVRAQEEQDFLDGLPTYVSPQEDYLEKRMKASIAQHYRSKAGA